MPDATDRVTAEIQTLFRLGGSRRIHQQQSEAAGVSLTQQALRVLERVAETGHTTPGELASKLDVDPAVVTRLLRQLEDGGLVTRGRREGDARVSTVEVSEAGLDAFRRVRQVIWAQVRRALVNWPESDLDALAGLLSHLVRDVQREPYRSPDLSTPSGKVSSKVPSR